MKMLLTPRNLLYMLSMDICVVWIGIFFFFSPFWGLILLDTHCHHALDILFEAGYQGSSWIPFVADEFVVLDNLYAFEGLLTCVALLRSLHFR